MTATTENKYAFPLQAAVEPHDLYGFHKDYLNQLPELRASIANKTGKFSEIFVKRLKPDGTVKQKVFKGTVKNHVSNGFYFETNETWSGLHDEPQTMFFRYDNILADLPVLSFDTHIYTFPKKSNVKEYMLWLKQIRGVLSGLVGKSHFVRLNYKYSTDYPLYRNGNFHVIGKITKVNESNLEFHHYKTMAYLSSEDSYVNMVPHSGEIDRFIAGDRYLASIQIFEGEYQFNPHDD